ncbi:hypothetical protein [Janibacter anophelis]|uniref:hypothetical protein n=1 Tax=Janibacter anophelis TaxID=319054 RepID=UPI000AEE90DF|nr:hypothetical protein [Janibacter anophelis]
MAVQQGLDPERVAAVADRLATEGERLTQIHSTGTAMMGTLVESWAGPDLTHFHDTWHHSAPQIHAMAASLRAAARELHEQARAQLDASGQSGRGAAAGTTAGVAPAPAARPGGSSPWDGLTDYSRNLLVPDDKMIDTAKKIADHTRDGIEEGVDRVNEGVDWLGDRAEDAGDWGQDKAERLTASVTDLLLTGTAGRVGGGLGILLETTPFFRDGHGEAVAVVDLDTTNQVRDSHGNWHPAVSEPTSLEEIMRGTSSAYANDSNVRITTITHADGSKAYIVQTPGTQTFTPGTGSNPLDSMGNFATVHGGSSASTEAVWDAMEKAGIPPGAPILMAGHSQGGMINQTLMSDPRFMERFNVTHAMTYGSPVESIPDTSGARQLHLQHEGDIVPRVDLGNTPEQSLLRDSSDVVTLDNPPGVWETEPVKNHGLGQPFVWPGKDPYTEITGAHSHDAYADSVAASKQPKITSFENDLDEFIVQPHDGSKVTGVDVEIRRK